MRRLPYSAPLIGLHRRPRRPPFDMAARRLSKTLFFNRQNATSGQNPCVFTCILKDRPFYHWFFMVFAKYGLLGSIQGFPQDSQVRQGSSKRPLWPSGPKVIPPWAQSCRGEFFGRVWTKTNDILPRMINDYRPLLRS